MLVDFVGGHNEAQLVLVLLKQGREHGHILGPAAAHNQYRVPVVGEGVNQGQGAGRGRGRAHHRIEAGVAGHARVPEAGLAQQLHRALVLGEDVGEAAQRPAEKAAPGLKEHLVGPENGRYADGRNLAALELREEVVPELVLYEHGQLGPDGIEEGAGISGRIEGQVEHVGRPGPVAAHFVARGREEGEHQLVVGMLGQVGFHQRPALLKLAQGGAVKPHQRGRFLAQLTPDAVQQAPTAGRPEGGLGHEGRQQPQQQGVKVQAQGIQKAQGVVIRAS